MRIGFITQEYPPEIEGGAGTYAYRLVNELADHGHQIVVFTPQKSKTLNGNGGSDKIRIVPISIPDIPLSMALFWIKIKKIVCNQDKMEKFDIIHINGPTFWLPGKRMTFAPIILTLHHLVGDTDVAQIPRIKMGLKKLGGENSWIVKLFEEYCVRNSDEIIAVSDFTRQRIIARYSQTVNCITTIYEAPDPRPNQIISRREEWREKLGITIEKIVLFVGRLNDPRKGLDLLLMALSKQPDLTDYVLIIVGKGNPEPIKKLAYDLELIDRIRILGFVESSDLLELYDLCDLYVVPSRLEGFGLTVLDAAAAGKRVVATRVGAIPEIGGPGTILVEPNNPNALADGISLALSEQISSPDIIREHASHFNWSNVAHSTEKLYAQCKEKYSRRKVL